MGLPPHHHLPLCGEGVRRLTCARTPSPLCIDGEAPWPSPQAPPLCIEGVDARAWARRSPLCTVVPAPYPRVTTSPRPFQPLYPTLTRLLAALAAFSRVLLGCGVRLPRFPASGRLPEGLEGCERRRRRRRRRHRLAQGLTVRFELSLGLFPALNCFPRPLNERYLKNALSSAEKLTF